MSETKLKVNHKTVYTYGQPVRRSRHLLRMLPVVDHYQALDSWNVDINVDGNRISFQDVFGNEAEIFEPLQPFQEMVLEASGVVSIAPGRPIAQGGPLQDEYIPLVWMPFEMRMNQQYLYSPELPETQLRELYVFGMDIARANQNQLLPTLKAINQTISSGFLYMPGSTHHKTTAYDTLINRRGVCQDFTNFFVCVARLLSVPARYRMGYVLAGDGDTQDLSLDTHAWVECYLPGHGWMGFDPTNGTLPDQEHVRVACGRFYKDAAPVTGTIFEGGGNENLSASVRVEKI